MLQAVDHSRVPKSHDFRLKKKKKTIQNKRLQFPENNKLKGGMAKVGTIANLGYHCKPLLWKALALRERQKRP